MIDESRQSLLELLAEFNLPTGIFIGPSFIAFDRNYAYKVANKLAGKWTWIDYDSANQKYFFPVIVRNFPSAYGCKVRVIVSEGPDTRVMIVFDNSVRCRIFRMLHLGED